MNLALFDLDNTLLAGDSDFEWAQFLISQGALDAEIHAAQNEKFYEQYKEAKEELLKLKTAKQNVASFFREEEQTQQER